VAQWYTDMYESIDAGNLDGYLAHLSDDVVMTVANNEPTVGKSAVEALLAASMVEGASHTWEHEYTDGDTTALEGKLTLKREGREVEVPVVSMLHRNGDGLVDSLRSYMDGTPIFALIADTAAGE
jgi:ketosteroid isomerase-like protein